MNEKITETETENDDSSIIEEVIENDTTQDAQGEATNDFLNDPAVLAYIEKQVAEGIKKALKGKSPKASPKDPSEQEQKDFDRMTYKERLNLFKTNPQSYYKLSKGAK